MSHTNNISGVFNATLFTVCVDPEIADQIVHDAEKMPWLVNSSNFEAYISSARRPYFGAQAKACHACIAVVDFDVDPDQAVETTRYLHQMFPGKITVIALAESRHPDVLLKAMRGGCNEFLHKPFNHAEYQKLLDGLNQNFTSSTLRNAPLGSVLSFFGAKGGVGTTTLAVHMATYLVQCHQKRVLLIDMHPELGHACVYLGLDGSRYPFHEVVRNVNRLDSELLHGFIARHPNGLEVLSSPDVCGGTKELDPESVTKTLEFLRSEYDYIVLDCATALDPLNLAVIELTARIYLVATPEIGAIRDLSRYVDNLMQIDYTTEKIHVVVNRFSSRYAVSIEQIEKAIRLPVAIKLPNCYVELVRSVNLGEPVSLNTKSEFASQCVSWANTLVGATYSEPKAKKEKGKLAAWF